MENLALSLVALAVGPLAVLAVRQHRSMTVFIDAFVLVAVGGLVLLHIFPESLARGGWPAFAASIGGLILPIFIEKGLRPGGGTRFLIVVLALTGLALHTTIDGIFLNIDPHAGHTHGPGDDHHHGTVLAWAVILHRIPVGIGIWWIVARTMGVKVAVLTLGVTMTGTCVGYAIGPDTLSGATMSGVAIFEALLAGSLMHVVLHTDIPAPETDKRSRFQIASMAGVVAALVVLLAIGHPHDHGGDTSKAIDAGHIFLGLAVASAPVLLFAYFATGLAQVFMPASWFQKINVGSTWSQALRGMAIGIPIPVCSCGVVPLYRELVSKGTGVAAAVAFLIATPELEIAAIFLTARLMGPELAFARVAAAAVLAVAVALFLSRLGSRRTEAPQPEPAEKKSCCATLPAEPLPEHSEEESCCSKGPDAAQPAAGGGLREALRFGFGEAVDNTMPWILLGLGVSAVLMPYVSPEVMRSIPRWIDVPAAALLGLPIYVCASGSTPVAAMLVAQGLSPGAAIAFLLTGPATNATTFGVLSRLHGQRFGWSFVASMLVFATGLGYLVNAFLPSVEGLELVAHEHASLWSFQGACLLVLTAVVAGSILRNGVRAFIERLFRAPTEEDETHAGHSH